MKVFRLTPLPLSPEKGLENPLNMRMFGPQSRSRLQREEKNRHHDIYAELMVASLNKQHIDKNYWALITEFSKMLQDIQTTSVKFWRKRSRNHHSWLHRRICKRNDFQTKRTGGTQAPPAGCFSTFCLSCVSFYRRLTQPFLHVHYFRAVSTTWILPAQLWGCVELTLWKKKRGSGGWTQLILKPVIRYWTKP
jgi:hypothetical protein